MAGEKNHNVDVITAMPYYPEWSKKAAYKNKWWFKETIAGASVYRCPLYVPKKVTGASRMIHEFSFFLSSSFYWIRFLFKKYDIIFTPYPPLIIGFWPWLYKVFHPKSTWVFHIQDLQVDAAKELGLIKNKTALRILEKIELFWLKKCDYVSSISEGMRDRILAKGIDKSKYIMLANWAETDIIKPLPVSESMRTELGIPLDSKVILYSGNLGEKQGVELLIDVAAEFKAQPDILFVIAGEGASKIRLIEYATAKNVTNVLFLPLQEYSKLTFFLACADIHMVIQKKSAADLVLPSKFMSILSAGAVALVTAEPGTSLYSMITDHSLAHMCEAENKTAVFESINSILANDQTQIKNNARTFAEKHLSIDSILATFIQKFSKNLSEYV
ncbi:WcaI family glycosyltransferase [Cytophaga aurantiaca]|uniref:WcaI family glycosyltransferase n=1 Tax=Cytophaga aurantiaca TaxID=29530 RepID=UPI00036CD5DA|nr:WcaI family glycosyltransferase [Cytophaga aurantiaca]